MRVLGVELNVPDPVLVAVHHSQWLCAAPSPAYQNVCIVTLRHTPYVPFTRSRETCATSCLPGTLGRAQFKIHTSRS